MFFPNFTFICQFYVQWLLKLQTWLRIIKTAMVSKITPNINWKSESNQLITFDRTNICELKPKYQRIER